MIRIVWAGDSTVAFNRADTYPQAGLSQGLPLFLKDDVFVRSFAVNGRSTKSFIDEGRLAIIDSYLNEGDFLFIEFGHNDEKIEDPSRYTDPFTSYKDNLREFIKVARKYGAYPLLITSVARRRFDESGVFMSGSHGEYPKAMKEVASEENVPVVDLTSLTESYIEGLGDIGSRDMFVYPKDNTHLTTYGAMMIAKLLAEGIKALPAPYSDLIYIKEEESL
ncbi:MAG: rhamnogalacturonan acetylesterase [Clostridiales bacterium]|nr:rhamnogalacturonan acetylesterase [Clostridiales bacterium]